MLNGSSPMAYLSVTDDEVDGGLIVGAGVIEKSDKSQNKESTKALIDMLYH